MLLAYIFKRAFKRTPRIYTMFPIPSLLPWATRGCLICEVGKALVFLFYRSEDLIAKMVNALIKVTQEMWFPYLSAASSNRIIKLSAGRFPILIFTFFSSLSPLHHSGVS